MCLSNSTSSDPNWIEVYPRIQCLDSRPWTQSHCPLEILEENMIWSASSTLMRLRYTFSLTPNLKKRGGSNKRFREPLKILAVDDSSPTNWIQRSLKCYLSAHMNRWRKRVWTSILVGKSWIEPSECVWNVGFYSPPTYRLWNMYTGHRTTIFTISATTKVRLVHSSIV